MTRTHVFLVAVAYASALIASSMVSARVIEDTLHVSIMNMSRLCSEQLIPVVNKSLPGPIIEAREGDAIILHVLNDSPYELTIHWHGIHQLLSCWADGATYVTQCPILPGNNYTYKFTIREQEGTMWWHAHHQWLRATLYGAFIIRPKGGRPYAYNVTPYEEVVIALGEWWNANVVDVEMEGLATGGGFNNSDAFTINGLPGDLYPCTSQNETYELKVVQGKTYLLRIINAALNNQLFFMIAHHSFTVVAVDSSYTNPCKTDVILVAPGQTTDVLLIADQSPGTYYMAARAYASAAGVPIDNTTTRARLVYDGANDAPSTPPMPRLPDYNDTATAHRFYSNLTALLTAPFRYPVPTHVDHHMFIAFGFGLYPCGENATCEGPFGQRLAASMNNISFVFPSRQSILEAHFYGLSGAYDVGFPSQPLRIFDYTNTSLSLDRSLLMTNKSTIVKEFEFNSTIEIVWQNTALVTIENHPMHIHGFDFHVMAQGFGNYDPENDPVKFNLKDPQIRNTIGVPAGGWAVIRFRANNPGSWLVHCHLDSHLPWGLAGVFIVKNGGTNASTLPPPPKDLPSCEA
ncbi:laccase-7-like [Malania oleifera]|uniref:laccase-7-like n=1 Tax=Malania oleifera TaxID=397392 RepID=UPI0025ADD667|nr:laccase-7-like [Malania oleifera]